MTDISNISDGTNIYALKDSNAVHKTDDEIINGTKTFLNEINGYLKSYCATNGNTNTYPYKKLGECVLSGTYQTVNVPFLYAKLNSDITNAFYQGKIILRTEATTGTLNEANSGIILNIVPNYIINDNISFYVCYKNNTPTANDVTCQIWAYIKTTYSGVCILPMRQGLGSSTFSSDKMTWGTNLVETASLPSDYTSIKHILISDNSTTPATSDNSTKIATTAFVKAQGYTSNTGTITGINMNGASKGTSGVVDLGTVLTEHQSLTNYVTTNTTQTISKTKTFTDSQIVSGASKVLKIKNTNVTRNTAPSSAVNAIYINGLDSADKNLWGIYGTWSTTKQNQVQLVCYKGTSTDNTYTGIGVGYDSSGNAYTYAPTPAVSDSSTKIATTAYVNNKFKVVTSLPASPDANTIYFIKE